VRATGGLADVVRVGRTTTDTILLATGDAPAVSAGGITTDAPFASVRRERGRVTHVAMAKGTYVEVDGVRILEVDGGPVTVAADAGKLDASQPVRASGSVSVSDVVALSAAPATPLPATGGDHQPFVLAVLVVALAGVEGLRRRGRAR
jgi:hypothetical protein